MREIVMDTETTGLDPLEGHRIVEIGCVELKGHVPTGATYHQYVNPERSMPTEAFEVHGLGDDFLSKQPAFREIADSFLKFVGDAKLVIHNASFDMKFLNAELGWLKKQPLPTDQAIDTLALARKQFPGAPASLDALCRRFGVDNSAREKHGALLDSEILAEVYLELIGGRQPGFGLTDNLVSTSDSTGTDKASVARPAPLPPRITEDERTAHAAFVAELGEAALWRKFD
ncbi:MAG: DNA polymerase III subunit epsilon [Pseudomonadota bacterium]